jgi:hypothetical protein
MEQENQPTIDEIKQIADTKRKLKNPTKYNLFVKEQMEKMKTESISNKDKLSTISKKWKEHKEQLPASLPEPEELLQPTESKRKIKRIPKSKPELELEPEPKFIPEPEPSFIPEPKFIPEPNNNHNNDFSILKENISNIKDLLEEIMKSKIKSKPQPKPRPNPALKRVNNTLDLTINDKEIEEIIKPDKKQDNTKDDKLKAFLDAMTKNK